MNIEFSASWPLEYPQKWDEQLQACMFALRTKKHMTTGFSPFRLMYGREARTSTQISANYEVRGSNSCRWIVVVESLFE